ncbi:hypothetical protein WJX72_008469 [[Myrmecia] bisecta]|uniref:Uncharacterized protein n=1 Tax=[Myrmecia] bisecta TaxID=41462 RepID=A0AAW1R8C3_9CHLO
MGRTAALLCAVVICQLCGGQARLPATFALPEEVHLSTPLYSYTASYFSDSTSGSPVNVTVITEALGTTSLYCLLMKACGDPSSSASSAVAPVEGAASSITLAGTANAAARGDILALVETNIITSTLVRDPNTGATSISTTQSSAASLQRPTARGKPVSAS